MMYAPQWQSDVESMSISNFGSKLVGPEDQTNRFETKINNATDATVWQSDVEIIALIYLHLRRAGPCDYFNM